MSSMTMHGIEPELEKRLRREAAMNGKSLNQTLKKLLGSAVGIGNEAVSHRDDYMDFFGVWTADDEQSFNAAVDSCNKVDPGDWS